MGKVLAFPGKQMVPLQDLKYYSITIRFSDRNERAVIVKAPSVSDVQKTISKWRGNVMSITEVLLPSGATLSVLENKV